MAFMKTFRKAYVKAKNIMETGDSDALVRARIYLESTQLQESILLPDVTIAGDRMHSRLEMFGKTALFTSIPELLGDAIIDLYRKRNRV